MSGVRDFRAAGDGKTDDAEAIEHALTEGDGALEFPTGDNLLSQTVKIDFAERQRLAIDGSGGTAKLVMAGEGPAFHAIGTHDASADPAGFRPQVWRRERMRVRSSTTAKRASPRWPAPRRWCATDCWNSSAASA